MKVGKKKGRKEEGKPQMRGSGNGRGRMVMHSNEAPNDNVAVGTTFGMPASHAPT